MIDTDKMREQYGHYVAVKVCVKNACQRCAVMVLCDEVERLRAERDAALERERRLIDAVRTNLETEHAEQILSSTDEPEPSSPFEPDRLEALEARVSRLEAQSSVFGNQPEPYSREALADENGGFSERAGTQTAHTWHRKEPNGDVYFGVEGIDDWAEYFRDEASETTWTYSSTQPANPLRTHFGTEPPDDLAPTQMVEWIDMDSWTFHHEPASNIPWALIYGLKYRPLLDPEGVQYCSAGGLEDWAEYVATDKNGEVWQYTHKPCEDVLKGVWGKGPKWTLRDGDAKKAPDAHKKPGDWRESLMRVWREAK